MVDYLISLIFRGMVLIIRPLPMSAVYALSRACVPLISLYRRRVVEENLRKSFPEWPQEHIYRVRRTFYKRFADGFFEALKGYSFSRKQVRRHFKFANPQLVEKYAADRPFILMGGHFFNWEWGVMSINLVLKHKIVGVYKPLSNRFMEEAVANYRTRWGLELVAMKNVLRKIIAGRHEPTAFLFVADQSPFRLSKAIWLDFLGRETPFISGPERLAGKYHLPVLYYSVERKKRGNYVLTFKLLSENSAGEDENEITRKFRDLLTEDIQKDPASWLWTHKRWKRAR